MNQTEQMNINLETLTRVLSNMLNKNIIHADYRTEQLHGGTLGDIRLVTGTSKAADGGEIPYNVVLKMQKKWERSGDLDSWRREYDLYVSDFGKNFDSFRWPKCYHTEINNDGIQIWMEYIDGISGNNLTIEMLEQAALELGRFQGRLYKQPDLLKHFICLSDVDTITREYNKWYSEKDVFNYLSSDECTIPKHLCKMFFDMGNNIEKIFENIKKLPIVLCHKDFWVENIMYTNGKIVIIDWDCVGLGYLGEDLASLIIDETYTWCIEEYYKRLIPAYYKGFSEYADISLIKNHCIHDMILMKFGYRLVRGYQYVKSTEHKEQHIIALQKIYEMSRY